MQNQGLELRLALLRVLREYPALWQRYSTPKRLACHPFRALATTPTCHTRAFMRQTFQQWPDFPSQAIVATRRMALR